MGEDVLVPIVTGVLGLITGVIAASWRAGLELAVRYDLELRAARVEAYRNLWARLRPLAVHADPGELTPPRLAALAEETMQWYFEVGGLFMGRGSQRKFVELQDELAKASKRAEGALEPDAQHRLREAASDLRTRMTRDVLSRRGALLGRDRFAR